MILIDSCIWIDAARKRKELPDFYTALKQFRVEEMAVCGIIMAEVIPFILDPRERGFTREFLDSLLFLAPDDDRIYWDHVLDAHDHLRKHGLHQIGIPDIMIMMLAKEHRASLLSLDKHFFKASKSLRIEVFHPRDLSA